MKLSLSVGLTANQNVVAGVSLSVSGLTGGIAEISTHASIAATMSDASTITAIRWGSAVDGTQFGTGANPTDFAASDGGTLHVRATAGGVDYYRSYPIRYAIPSANATPSISGSTGFGDTLTFTGVGWTPSGNVSLSRQWRRGGVDISGEVGTTYDIAAADSGADITCVQIGTNSGGTTETASNAITAQTFTAPVISGVPTISGTEEQGQTLTATAASHTGNPTPTETWQWERSGAAISGATSSTYLLAAADVGETITVVQTETNAIGSDVAESAATGTIAAASDVTAPTISSFTYDDPNDEFDVSVDEGGTLHWASSTQANSPTFDGTTWTGTTHETGSNAISAGANSFTGPTNPSTPYGAQRISIYVKDAAGNLSTVSRVDYTFDAVPDAFVDADWSVATGSGANELDVTIASLPSANGNTITDVEYDIDASGTWVSSGGTVSFTITAAAASTSYAIRLRAVNGEGDSAAGNSESATSGASASVAAVVTSAATGGGTGSSISATLPASLVTGNHLIAFVTNPNLFATNAPSGWTQFANVTPGHANYNEVYGFWREIDGTEGASQTFSGDWKNRAAIIYQVENLPATPTFNVGTSDNASGGTINAPGLSISDDELLFTIFGNRSALTMSPTADHAVGSGTTKIAVRSDDGQTSGTTSAETSATSADWWYGVQIGVI